MKHNEKCDVILEMLKKEKDFVTGSLIAEILHTSRVTVSNSVKILVQEGYEILSVTNRGYKLISSPDVITAVDLSEYLKRDTTDDITCLSVTASTNDYLKKLAFYGAREGSVVVASEQTAGKGRLGKSFFSPKDSGIYMSYLYRPEASLSELSTLTGRVAVAVIKAIKTVCSIDVSVKWVNDLILNGKKICGILTELSIFGETMNAEYAIVGIGINVNNDKSEFDGELSKIATSLYAESGNKFDRNRLVAEIINNLDELFEVSVADSIEFYRSKCINIGKEVSFTYNGCLMSGVVLAIDDSFGLLVKVGDNVLTLSSGEVSIKNID